MRTRLILLAGGLAAAVLVARAARFRRAARPPLPPEADPDPRAGELRRRLAESRALAGEREEFESAETPIDAAPTVAGDVDERRRAVHEEGRAVADEMRGSPAQ